MSTFFKSELNNNIFRKFLLSIETIDSTSEFEKERNKIIIMILNSMLNNQTLWDRSCQINIEWIGEKFLSLLNNEDRELSSRKLGDLFTLCLRFMLEHDISTKSNLNNDFQNARRFAISNLKDFDQTAQNQIEYAFLEMPTAILKAVLHSDSMSEVIEFNKTADKSNELQKTWDASIAEKEERVKKLKNSLSEYENAYNFVGLYQGFDDLATEKKEEKDNIKWWLKFVSVLVVIPIILELFLIYVFIFNGNFSDVKEELLFSIIPSMSLVAISIYYFRVLLFNYKSVKAQLLQIDLRKTLCRFIQSYAVYSGDIKKSDEVSLEKFENIIFSGIVTNDGNLPSTYDGVEQIGKLFKSVKP